MTHQPALLRVVWSAQAEAQAEQPKEPPPRTALPTRQDPTHSFDYNWEERLKAVDPNLHPLMRFTDYHIYEARLYKAVEILNATPDVENDHAIECVLEAFWALRRARSNQNILNREEYRGRDDFAMAGEDMEKLLDLAMLTKSGSSLRVRLEHDWRRGMMVREADGTTRTLCGELKTQLRETIPGTPKAALLMDILSQFELRRYQREIAASGGLKIAK